MEFLEFLTTFEDYVSIWYLLAVLGVGAVFTRVNGAAKLLKWIPTTALKVLFISAIIGVGFFFLEREESVEWTLLLRKYIITFSFGNSLYDLLFKRLLNKIGISD